jgi:uncharacterized protein YjbI with pentapeptide repeats
MTGGFSGTGIGMTRDESIALFLQGREAWNAWAEALLAEKKALEAAGRWQVHDDDRDQNDETRAWIAAATIDLSGLLFVTQALADAAEQQTGHKKKLPPPSEADVKSILVEGDVIDFSGFIFPWQARFEDAQFHGKAVFWSAQFHGAAGFGRAQFHGEAGFGGAQFHGAAGFWSAQFLEAAGFGEAQFHGAAEFGEAQFHGAAGFWSAQFHGGAGFGGAQFHGEAGFWSAQFLEAAVFADATFKASTSFVKARFGDRTNPWSAIFTGIKVERAFDMTGAAFSKVPAFNQADFAQAPDLDDVRYPHPPFFRFWVRGWADEEKTLRRADLLKADAAKYRHLRRLAILGHDHENEAKAFKGETRAKRGTEHKPWHAAYWFGLIYDAFSDFGRSMMRPFYAWAALTAVFAAFYLATSGAPSLWACAPAAEGLKAGITALGEAAYLAVKNGLIVIGLGSEGKINQAHACLYGGTVGAPVFPSGISIWQIVQNLLSAPIIFLFLLGVRNNFKIK